jgi:hypothetical protein
VSNTLQQKFPAKPESENNDPLHSELHEFKLNLQTWINKRFKEKTKLPAQPILQRSEDSFINPEVVEMAVQMANGQVVDEKDLWRAAQFIAGIQEPSEDMVVQGQDFYDDDPEFAIMYAFGIERTEKNRLNIRMIAKLSTVDDNNEFRKNEQDPLEIIPGHYTSLSAVEAVKRALDAKKVFSINLGGKYSDHSQIAKDPKNGMLWLIKPGEKKLSPASGVRQERANLAQREAAFYACAQEMGLGAVVPKTFLLKINGKYTATMPFLPQDFMQADKIRKQNPLRIKEILDKYKNVGQLHIWAAVEMILGNTDSHGGNLMVSKDGSVALIDHGGSFAGDQFDPAGDDSSFCPFYLRYTVPKGFKRMSNEERYRNMPQIDAKTDMTVKKFIKNIDEFKIKRILEDFGINPKPSLDRLHKLKQQTEKLSLISDFLNRFWSGNWN